MIFTFCHFLGGLCHSAKHCFRRVWKIGMVTIPLYPIFLVRYIPITLLLKSPIISISVVNEYPSLKPTSYQQALRMAQPTHLWYLMIGYLGYSWWCNIGVINGYNILISMVIIIINFKAPITYLYSYIVMIIIVMIIMTYWHSIYIYIKTYIELPKFYNYSL